MIKQVNPNDGKRFGNSKFFFKGDEFYSCANDVHGEGIESPLWLSDEQIKSLFFYIENRDHVIYKTQYSIVSWLFGFSDVSLERYNHEYICNTAIIDGCAYDLKNIKDVFNFLIEKNVLRCLAKKVADKVLCERSNYDRLIRTERKMVSLCKKIYDKSELYIAEEKRWKLYGDSEYNLVWNGYYEKAEKELAKRAKRIRKRITESDIETFRKAGRGYKPTIIRKPRKIIVK